MAGIGGFALALVLTLTAFVAATRASTFSEEDQNCTLCAMSFTTMMASTGAQFGTRLDLKPIGPVAAPVPVHVCPKCHFVVLDEKFDDAELTRLRRYVGTPAYQAYAKGRSSYYVMAKLMVALRRDELSLAHVYLKASWQEEDDAPKLREDLEFSLRHFEAFLIQRLQSRPEPGTDAAATEAYAGEYRTAQFVKGEILRRLGRFDDAVAYLKELQQRASFQGSPVADLIAYELRLCGEKDAGPHAMEEAAPAAKTGAQGAE